MKCSLEEKDDKRFPLRLQAVNRFTIAAMFWLNGAAHVIIGLALALSVLMFTWLFFVDVRQAADANNLVHGFVHALGTLMLLWTISALITAEIRYLEGNKLEVDTFVEVALVVVLRKVITMPVLAVQPPLQEILLWNIAALMLGVLFFLVRWAQRQQDNIPSQNAVK
ncbi:MAG: hypothetical protein AUK53_02995 [Betaproteobacteria bacterium CG2_30_59_46]|nr:MAG: hypothetical protein AUK53_02995 [Betaproteobacteria bacterium CG2_30_59_46]PIQ10195.1 MAG: hypothetical protein COW70_14045 [Hydrogenophilales bacterium CG18_big_fil_WC_8_21_14_2_50_58_12]PIY00660.1 MAG: hypothetical protein COZ23_07425 [Hydrogenophilales bacterium CG_4_10_14_3_um_filter_58_23]PJB07058.1 MAG: hypothetical protein CO125_05585 [Hydrogenophilales bacterium CG_4_9_14_3_um_filter_59_35]